MSYAAAAQLMQVETETYTAGVRFDEQVRGGKRERMLCFLLGQTLDLPD